MQLLFYPPRTLGDHLPPVPKSRRRRNPIIIVHAVVESGADSQDLANSLRRDGWEVFTPTKPAHGMTGVEINARSLASEVARVQALTGAAQVDLIGHSQGGLDIRWYSQVMEGARNVGRIITLDSPHHGVASYYMKLKNFVEGLGFYHLVPSGLLELVQGSAMLRRLAAAPLTTDDPPFTSIYSADWDQVVTPVSSPVLEGARNVALVQPMRRLFSGPKRGPWHLDINHTSEEAYAAIRDALLGAAKPAPSAVVDAASRGAQLAQTHVLARRRRRASLVRS